MIAGLVCFLPWRSAALEVAGHAPAVNDRFSSGYPQKPVPNQSGKFIGTGLDWSGVGWNPQEANHSVTLISPKHFVFAAHQGVGGPGAELHFVNRDGILKRYVIAKVQQVPFAPGPSGKTKHSDVSIGTLREEIPPTDGVRHYRVLFLGQDFSKYLRQRLFVYGHSARIGFNEIIDGAVTPGEAAKMRFIDSAHIPGMARTQSGDSGSPSFVFHQGELALVGTHSEICEDTFVPALIGPLMQILAAEGQRLGVLDGSKR